MAQAGNATIDTIRDLNTINPGDQQRIADWIEGEVKDLVADVAAKKPEAFSSFRSRMETQFTHNKNTPAFKTQLAAKMATVAVKELSNPATHPTVAAAIARVLVDMEAEDTIPGLLAALKSSASAARFLGARGLAALQDAVSKNKSKLAEVAAALQAAGASEADPNVLSQIYRALAYRGQVVDVIAAYMAILDARLTARRPRPEIADPAELDVYEFFRMPGAVTSLNADQKAQLVQRLAVFLRLDAQRYDTPNLSQSEMIKLERTLEGAEAVLSLIVPGKPAVVAEELGKGGKVLSQVYKWIGDPSTKETGILNAPPWNVPVGAP